MEHFICFLIIVLSFVPLQSLNVEAKITGFSVDIIHHDSKLSPFYNSSKTPRELSRNAALRSIARANKFLLPSNSLDESKLESPVIPNGGAYLTKLSLGTPPFEIYAIADTGSDLIWTQCEPCDDQNCFPQDRPKFNPGKSSTYSVLPCDSNPCQALPDSTCINNECLYRYIC